MTLPKSARTITVLHKKYRWTVSTPKFNEKDGAYYVKITVEGPDKSFKEFEECTGTDKKDSYPITPLLISAFIRNQFK